MKKIVHKLRRINPFSKRNAAPLPTPRPGDPSLRVVKVFVEGYEDVAFWRGIFDSFANPYLQFEISVPNLKNLPKGKKVLLSMIPEASEGLLLCVDSDFDYLFDGQTEQSELMLSSRFMFHTYTYATENYLCYAPSLHNVCVKATKNDTRIFDFERFMADYSRTIYRLFLWYAYSAKLSDEHMFTLNEFKSSVKIHYLDLEENGANTIAWLERNVARREQMLESRFPQRAKELDAFAEEMAARGVTPETTYLYMHGHTLMDNVVMVMLETVCEKLRQMSLAKITASSKEGVALKNEISNYNNSQRSIRDVLLDNENYDKCPLFKQLYRDIERYLLRAIWRMRQQGEIPSSASVISLARSFRK